jgi:hypothetical protein
MPMELMIPVETGTIMCRLVMLSQPFPSSSQLDLQWQLRYKHNTKTQIDSLLTKNTTHCQKNEGQYKHGQ